MNRYTWSYLSIILIGIIYLASLFHYEEWRHNAILGGGDQFGYYVYEPSVFIYHDLGSFNKTVNALCAKGHYPRNQENSLGVTELAETPTGHYSGKYTFGVALMQAPFFLMAHLYSIIRGLPTDGFSPTYIFFNCLSGLVYTLLGLLVLMKLLKRFFSDVITSITLLVVALATNLYYMQISPGAMAHPYLFFLYAVMFYGTLRFFEQPRLVLLLIIAFCCGMITLIRPNEVVVVLIPLIYGVTFLRPKGFISLLTNHFIWFIGATVAFMLPIIPQLVLWKWASGSFVFYSYGNEGFNFHHPHMWAGLTSGHNGWLFYTPVMVFALIGIAILFWKHRPLFFALSAFMAVTIFITYSWWCWNYINGFGSRPMVETYSLLAVPLGYFIQWGFARWSTKIILLPLFLFFGWLNIFQTYQLKRGILWSENASHTYVLHTIGKTKISRANFIEYDTDETQPDTSEMVKKGALFFSDLNDSTFAANHDTVAFSGKYSAAVQHHLSLSLYHVTCKEAQLKPGDWIRVSALCRSDGSSGIYTQSEMVAEFKDTHHNIIKWKGMAIQNKIGNPGNLIWSFETGKWAEVSYFTQVPNNINGGDEFYFSIWNANGPTILVDDAKVELWKY